MTFHLLLFLSSKASRKFLLVLSLRNQEIAAEVMIITGYGNLDNAREAIRLGAGDFISKPFNVADVIAMVSKVSERRSYNLKIRNLIKELKDLRSSLGENQKMFSE